MQVVPDGSETSYVVRDALSGRQWEALLAGPDTARAWLSPRMLTVDGWLTELFDATAPEPAATLSAAQSLALWRTVISNSTLGDALLEQRGAARWAAQAWQLLADWELDPEALHAAPDQPDFAAFLSWCRAYRAHLEDAGWHDRAALRLVLGQRDLPGSGRLVCLDLDDLTPAERAALRRVERRGWEVAQRSAPFEAAEQALYVFDDGPAELHGALEWAALHLERTPGARIALVLREPGSQLPVMERALATGHGYNDLSGRLEGRVYAPRRALDRPLVGEALNALEMLSGGGFAELSRWLRGPLVVTPGADATAGAAAALEVDLRGRMLAQVPVTDAYRRGGLRARFLHTAPALTERLDAAIHALGDPTRPRTPTQWAADWQRALRALGWVEVVQRSDRDALGGWERGLAQLVTLTPMLGEIGPAAALAELRVPLGTARHEGAFPRGGLHVLTRMDQVGPGYDAAWVTGLTATSFPEPARINPLLPRALQVAQGMPRSTPGDATRRAEHALARLRSRVRKLALSWPASEYDYEALPSPLLGAEQTASAQRPLSHAAGYSTGTDLASLEDRPTAFAGHTIRGGAQTLQLQALCPLRAFCQSRLGARPLDPPARGVSARHQGIAVHRALELWLGEPAQSVAAAVAVALDELFRGTAGRLAALRELERTRLESLLERFKAREAERAGFRVEALEQRRDIEVGGRRVRLRIDRVDRLDDGSIAILDYKAGRKVARPGWFQPRLEDPQLPLYLLDASDHTRSLVIVALAGEDGPRYIGLWDDDAHFPGRAVTLPDGRDWHAQCRVWRRQLESLVDEFVSGDVRVFSDRPALAKEAYAPLSRFHELLALRQRKIAL